MGTELRMARKYWIGGNWKCSLSEVQAVIDLTKALSADASKVASNCEVVVCPSPVHLYQVQQVLKECCGERESCVKGKVVVGSQNVSKEGPGAYTGESSVEQLLSLGVTTTLVGHSERRTIYGESDAIVADKVAKCQDSKDMIAVICIGETREERESGKVLEVNSRQLKACFPKIKDWSRIVIAYEPVWAIGTGLTATPEQAQETHKQIRDYVAKEVSREVADAVRIVYGGSMNANNAKELLSCADIDGGLVGGA